MRTKAVLAIILVILAIVLFIAFVFRHVAEPVQSWKYGVVAIVTLLHDVIVPLGVFSVLGHFGLAEIDTLFVTALLVILGFSIHDTIVVFDRVRENLRINKQGHHKLSFDEVVGKSLKQTYARSINTSLTTLLTLAALYLFGSTTTENFALAMFIGIAVGTYSSICIASPLLVTWHKFSSKRA
jgi:preprotein translocase subunit SecF